MHPLNSPRSLKSYRRDVFGCYAGAQMVETHSSATSPGRLYALSGRIAFCRHTVGAFTSDFLFNCLLVVLETRKTKKSDRFLRHYSQQAGPNRLQNNRSIQAHDCCADVVDCNGQCFGSPLRVRGAGGRLLCFLLMAGLNFGGRMVQSGHAL